MSLNYSVAHIPSFDVPCTVEPVPVSESERHAAFERINGWLKNNNAILVAHYYTDPLVQALAEYTGGFIGDSLAMADYGRRAAADTLIVAGVRFMGETAKILSPEKTILMPDENATCSLDLGCPAEQFAKFRALHKERVVVVYANTAAAVKAQADWVVTSSNAQAIVRHLDAQGHRILWAPDRHLGAYLQKQTAADMVLWQGACVVHDEYRAEALADLKMQHPGALVLAHPESPAAVLALADVVGSTTTLLNASINSPQSTCIVATDRGIFYKMQQASPHKQFIEAPTGGNGATCKSCGHCPWMAMNTLEKLEQACKNASPEIQLDPSIIARARLPLERMLDFSNNQ